MKGIINIDHNGSKVLGQPNDPIELLIERLKEHQLQDFSTYERLPRNGRRYWGNFVDISAGFSVDVKQGRSADKLFGKLFRSNRQRFRRK